MKQIVGKMLGDIFSGGGSVAAVQSATAPAKKISTADDLWSDEIDKLLNESWTYVSISKEQFETHYVGITRTILEFTQNSELVEAALQKCRVVLADSMINKLPRGRSREEGHAHEQLWKFTVFSKELIRGAKEERVVFLGEDDSPRLIVRDRRAHSSDTKGIEKAYFSGSQMIANFGFLFNETSTEWLSFDNGRALTEIINCMGGGSSFGIPQKPISSEPTLEEPVEPKDPVEADEPVEPDEDSGEAIAEEGEVSAEQKIEEEYVFDRESFVRWADKEGYKEDGVITIPGSRVIQGYIDECVKSDVSKMDVQEALLELGATPGERNVEGEKSWVYVWKI